VLAEQGAVNVKINDNTLVGQFDPYQVDDASRPASTSRTTSTSRPRRAG